MLATLTLSYISYRLSGALSPNLHIIFYASIAAGDCTIWLGFEPDPDQSPDLGSGHGFKIARQMR